MPRALALAVALAVLLAGPACSRKPVLEPLGRTGIQGVVTIGPACPVQRADSPCPNRPYRATITIRDTAGKTVVTFISNEDGSFRVDLDPGTYTLVPRNGRPLPRANPVEVTVREGSYSKVEITYDSGIR